MARTTLIICLALIFINCILAGRISKSAGNSGRVSKSKRIIGGTPATRHSFPHHVALLKPTKSKKYPNGKLPYCSGSIIEDQIILTAAHCITSDFFRTTILAGGHNHSKYEGTEQIIRVKSSIIHGRYKDEGLAHDIGLIMVAKPFKFNDYVKKIKLSEDPKYPTGEVKISGWGLTKGNTQSSIPELLQTATLVVQKFKDCSPLWYHFPSRAFCATVPGKKIDFCDGDSGGACIKKIDGEDVQFGVVNFSANECANEKKPGSFLSVGRYASWIRKAKAALLKGQKTVDESNEYTAEESVEDDFGKDIDGDDDEYKSDEYLEDSEEE